MGARALAIVALSFLGCSPALTGESPPQTAASIQPHMDYLVLAATLTARVVLAEKAP
jgi:hypothetical protein